MKLKTQKKLDNLKKISIKKKKKDLENENENKRILTIEERLHFIKLIIDNKYKITFNNKKNPLIIKYNNKSSNFSNYPEILVNNPNDLFKFFSKIPNEKKILGEKEGNSINSTGIPYIICKGSCNSQNIDKNHFKLGLKIILFNIEDLSDLISKQRVKIIIKNILKKIKDTKEREERNDTKDMKDTKDTKDTKELENIEGDKNFYKTLLTKDYKYSLINRLNYKELSSLYANIDNLNDMELYELYSKLDYNLNQNTELRIIKLLSTLVVGKRTPHINLPILEFQTTMNDFLKKKYLSLQEISTIFYSQNSLSNSNLINVLISEWCKGGSLESFLINNKLMFDKDEINLDVLFFQILSLLTTILIYYPNFKHNDLHLGNILVETNTKTNKYFLYKIKNIIETDKYTNYIIPDVGFQIRLWDYDLASIEGIIDNNYINAEFEENCLIVSKKNHYSDILKFAFMYNKNIISKNIIKNNKYNNLILQDILRKEYYFNSSNFEKKNNKLLYSKNYGCLLQNVEYTTPIILLKKYSLKSEYFGKFICKEEDLKNYSIIDTYIVD